MADGKVVYEITGDNSQFKKDTDETQHISENVFSGIKTAGKAAFAAIGAAALAVGAAILKIGKDSIEAYAEYEQLVGGVEKLFADSSDTVITYANNAYKTAGLSANEYMQTVTSFSASLISGLSGDTAAAARIADVAITDMADNANTFGTSIEDIQNAYQGFAKQNYTMLDNLKLGYGGTAAEMARLINDSGVLGDTMTVTADTVNSVSFDKIIEAIHETQERMNIAGTTAREASTTIQGSISSLSAAWKNFVTGMADENADFDALLGNLIDSAITVAGNLIPRIQILVPRLVDGLVSLINQLVPYVPQILSELIPSLVEGTIALFSSLLDISDDIINIAFDLIGQLALGLIEALPQMIDSAYEIVTNLCNYLADNMDQIIDTAIDLIMVLIDGLLDPENLNGLIEAGYKLVFSLIEGLIKAIPDLLIAIGKIIWLTLERLGLACGDIFDIAGEWVYNVAKGIKEKISEAIEATNQLIKDIKDTIKQKVSDFIQAGKDLLGGLISGISQKVGDAVQAVKDAVGKVVAGAKNLLGIASPSKVFKAFGQFIDMGLADGIKALADLPEDETLKMAAGIETSFDYAMPTFDDLQRSATVNFDANKNYIFNIKLDGKMECDGLTLGTILLRNIDDAASFVLRG